MNGQSIGKEATWGGLGRGGVPGRLGGGGGVEGGGGVKGGGRHGRRGDAKGWWRHCPPPLVCINIMHWPSRSFLLSGVANAILRLKQEVLSVPGGVSARFEKTTTPI